jgi:hypothetical protein
MVFAAESCCSMFSRQPMRADIFAPYSACQRSTRCMERFRCKIPPIASSAAREQVEPHTHEPLTPQAEHLPEVAHGRAAAGGLLLVRARDGLARRAHALLDSEKDRDRQQLQVPSRDYPRLPSWPRPSRSAPGCGPQSEKYYVSARQPQRRTSARAACCFCSRPRLSSSLLAASSSLGDVRALAGGRTKQRGSAVLSQGGQ